MSTLVELAGTFSMLHPCMHFKFLINKENTGSMHGEIFRITMELPLYQMEFQIMEPPLAK